MGFLMHWSEEKDKRKSDVFEKFQFKWKYNMTKLVNRLTTVQK